MNPEDIKLPEQLPVSGAAGTSTYAGSDPYAAEGSGMGVGEAVSAATGHWLHNLILEHPDMEDDPNFYWTEDLTKEMTTGVNTPEGQAYILDKSVGSRAEAEARRARVLQGQEEQQKIAASGGAATTAYILTQMFDPGEIAAVTAATAGLGTIPNRLQKIYKGSKVLDEMAKAAQLRKQYSVGRRALEGAAVGAGTSGVIESIRSAYEPEGTLDDLPMYMAFGGALGATVEGAAVSWSKLKRLSVYQKRKATGVPLLPEERALFADIIEDESLATAAKKFTPDFEARTGDIDIPDDAFDATNPRAYDNATRQRGTPLFGLRNVISSIAKTMSSESGLIRDLAPRLGHNAVGNVDGSAVRISAPEIQAWASSSSTARLAPILQNARKQWVTETYGRNIPFWKRGNYDREFNERIARMARRNQLDDPVLAPVVQQYQKEMANFVKMARDAKIRGYEALNPDPKYVPRVFDEPKIAGLMQRVGRGNVVKLVREAILRRQPEIDAKLLDDIADGYVGGIENRIKGVGSESMQVRTGIKEDTIDDIKQALVKKYGETRAEEIVAAFEGSVKQTKSGSGIPRTRRRLDLDETVSIKLDDGTELGFEDLLINDIEDLHQMYGFQMGGAIGLAKNGIEQEGMKSFLEILDDIRKDALSNPKMTRADLDAQMNALKFMYDGITGQLAHQTGVSESASRAMRRLREWNFMVSMGSSGLASMVEIMNVLLDHNMKTLVHGLPRLKGMISKMRTGELSDDLARELQQFTGVGTDMLTGRMRKGFDVDESEFLKADYTRADYLLAYGRNKIAVASGMLPITAMFRRADSMFYAMDWGNAARSMAKSGAYKSPFSKIKMEQLGINAEDGKKIISQINKHAEFDPNGKLRTLNLKDWDDTATRDLFSQTNYRHVMQSVQDTSQASLNRFLQSPIGKTVGQFLNYVLGSQEQQFQRLQARMMNGDAKTVSAILAGHALMGTLVYLARTSLATTGVSEEQRRRMLEEKLQPLRIIRDGSLGYMGPASVFMTFVQRVNGNNIISNPTIDAIERATSFTKTLGAKSINGDDFNENEVRRWLRMLPGSSTYPGIIGTNILADKIAN